MRQMDSRVLNGGEECKASLVEDGRKGAENASCLHSGVAGRVGS
jgi:hypothetical protein